MEIDNNTVFMKKSLLFILFLISSFCLHAQKDTVSISSNAVQKRTMAEASSINISIYPVPVRENHFSIRCDKEIAYIKVTNIIGQDIFKAQYNNPQTITKIILDNPRRGMYLVTIAFTDGVRIVKKIMVEQPE
jgi:hypothetical protein